MNTLKRFCGWIAEIGVRHPQLVVILGLLVVIGFGAIYVTLPPRYRLADQVPDREQAVAASEQLDEKLTGANPLHVMIDYPQGKTLYDPDVLKVIGDVHAMRRDPVGRRQCLVGRDAAALARQDAGGHARQAQGICLDPARLSDQALHRRERQFGRGHRAHPRRRCQRPAAGDREARRQARTSCVTPIPTTASSSPGSRPSPRATAPP